MFASSFKYFIRNKLVNQNYKLKHVQIIFINIIKNLS